MNVETRLRTVEPLALELSVTLTAEDLDAAFSGPDPDEDLFFAIFSSAWKHVTASRQLSLVASVADLTERAASLGLSASSPETKE